MKKPQPLTPVRSRKVCPICQKPSYSASGVHPQCSANKADRERKAEIKAAEEADETGKAPSPSAWRKNRCPQCGSEVAVRLKVCTCGRALL